MSVNLSFKFLDRGRKEVLALLPGWATDYKIFQGLEMDFNYLLTLETSPENFEKRLLRIIDEQRIEKVSLFGWSLGGFLAYEFALRYPQRVSKVILVSVRRGYSREEIERIKENLLTEKERSLYRFYFNCFFDKRAFYLNHSLFKRYSEQMDLSLLLKGLDYLSCVQMEVERLRKVRNLTIIHGEQDRIAPVKEVREMKSSLPSAELIIIKKAGHIPFLEGEAEASRDKLLWKGR